jgi:hypothetical protein
VNRPPDPDRIRDLFQEVNPPPGMGRWREVGPAPTPVRPVVRRKPAARSRLALVLGSAFAAVLVLAVLPLAGQLWRQTEAATTDPPYLVAPTSAGPASTSTAEVAKPTTAAPTPPAATTAPVRSHPATSGPSGPGVPAGVKLRPHAGDLLVTAAGTVVDGLTVTGSIIVRAPNVTIRNTRIAPKGGYWAVRQEARATNLTVRDSEIVGSGTQTGISQEATGLTVLRVAIHGVTTALAVRDRVTVQDSHLYEVSIGLVTQGGSEEVAIRHNTIATTQRGEAAIALYTHTGPVTGAVIADNVLAGGQYTIYAGEGAGSRDIRITGNRFSRSVHPDGGFYGPVAAWDRSAPGNAWERNTWEDTGSPVSP